MANENGNQNLNRNQCMPMMAFMPVPPMMVPSPPLMMPIPPFIMSAPMMMVIPPVPMPMPGTGMMPMMGMAPQAHQNNQQ